MAACAADGSKRKNPYRLQPDVLTELDRWLATQAQTRRIKRKLHLPSLLPAQLPTHLAGCQTRGPWMPWGRTTRCQIQSGSARCRGAERSTRLSGAACRWSGAPPPPARTFARLRSCSCVSALARVRACVCTCVLTPVQARTRRPAPADSLQGGNEALATMPPPARPREGKGRSVVAVPHTGAPRGLQGTPEV